MGTILVNPFELNFGLLAARNAENIKEAENSFNKEFAVETLTMGNTRYDVISSVATNCNTVSAYVVYVMKITTIDTGSIKYRVEYTSNGQNPIDSSQRFSTGGDFTNVTDATTEQNRFVTEQNVFRGEDGCTDSSALNYSPGALSSHCPCCVSTPVWTQGQDQSNNPQLQQITEKAGDCSCLMPPTDLDGHGYLVEKWTYIGTPFPAEYINNSQLVKQWRWKRDTGKSSLPQPNEDDIYYAIAKEGWRVTELNSAQEFIVKPTLSPTTWKKYRLTTATGFEKMGCMDNTAMNYDPEAQVQPAIPTATDWSEEYEAAAKRATKYKCQYCTDNDLNATIYNQDTGKCECKAGYSLKGGKCKKASANKGKEKEEEDEGMPMTTLLIGIVGITAVGLLTTMFGGGEKLE